MARVLTYWLVLYPLIKVNYALRRAGLTKDKWFWADLLALKWGFWQHGN